MNDVLTSDLLDVPPHPRLGDASRDGIVLAAIAAFRQHAFHEVDAETVAELGGIGADEVRACFPDFNALVAATIESWNGQRMRPILPVAEQHGAVEFLRAIVIANIADPALMRLLSAMVNIAATHDHPLSGLLQQQWLHFHAIVQRALIRDVQLDREPADIDCARGAEQLIAVYEGLQIQAMVRPGMRLLEGFDRAVTRLRDGWSQTYTAPVWQI